MQFAGEWRIFKNMDQQMVSVSRVIKASPEAIFDVLADPARHADIDGSGMVQKVRGDGTRLELGTKFGMAMKMGPVPYELIAWAHFGKHRWRYELEATEVDGVPATNVTETFDWSTARLPKAIELAGYPKKHPVNMEATLGLLAALFEA
jgi:hypothetical protein